MYLSVAKMFHNVIFFTVYVCVCTYPGLYWSVLLHAFTGVYFYTQIDNLCLMSLLHLFSLVQLFHCGL